MPFDPDKYLAQTDSKGFDPDAYLAESQTPEEVSTLESGVRGAAQGVSFSLADEIAGAAEAAGKATLGSDKLADLMANYRKYRDESRGAFKAAEQANPVAYTTGEIGAGVATGLLTGGAGAVANLGRVGAGAGLKELAKIGLRQGAATGLGASEADLTEGDIAGAAKDTAIGAGVGAAAGAILPNTVKGIGKAAGKVADFAVDEAPEFIKKGIKSFDLAKKGIDVVGTKAQESLDTESSKAANDIIQAFRNQYSQGSKMVGSALKSAPNQDFSAQMGKIESALSASKMLPDDLNRIQNELNMYKQSTTTETIEPGMEKAIASMQDLIDKQKGEAAVLGQSVDFIPQAPSQSGKYLQTLKKSMTPEGEQASVLQVAVPEDKVIKETVESFRNMDLQELNNVKQELSTFISGNNKLSNYSKSILSGVKKELDDALQSAMNPQSADLYKSGNAQMSKVYDAGELLGMVSPDKKFAKDLDIKLQNKLLSGTDTNKRILDRALGYGTEITPELKESISEFPVRQELLKNIAGEGSLFGGLVNPKGIAIRAGEKLGIVAGSTPVKTAKDFTKSIINYPDQKIVNIADKLSQSQNEGVKSLGTTLSKALQDATKRDRLLWALSQQPAFREAVNSVEQSEVEN